LKLARTKEWRESHGLTQRELAAEAGVGEVTVARVETGASVSPPTARKIAEALGVAVADLLERPPVPLAEAPQGTGATEDEAEEERRVIPQSAANLQMHIEQMKGLKELREAEMEEIEKGVGLSKALLNQMVMADKGLRDLLEELGVLDFAEAVRAGREMAQPEAIPLCHELLRRLAELEALSAEAQVASGVAEADIYIAGIKTASGAESFLAEQTAPEGS
jgi:transcriptional regulator with XRE-family HTH domain